MASTDATRRLSLVTSNYAAGDPVWLKDPDEAWVMAEVVEPADLLGKLVVRALETGEEHRDVATHDPRGGAGGQAGVQRAIQAIEALYGLPSPTIDGAWAKTARGGDKWRPSSVKNVMEKWEALK